MRTVILSLIVPIALASPTAQACSCRAIEGTPVQILEGVVARADLAFVGRVATLVEVRTPAEAAAPELVNVVDLAGHTMPEWKATLDVSRVYRGEGPASITVFTAFSDEACGATLEVGTEMLVLATRRDDRWTTSRCAGTRPVGDDPAVQAWLKSHGEAPQSSTRPPE